MNPPRKKDFFAVLLLFLAAAPCIQADVPEIVPLHAYENNILDSGGKLLEEQAALNIHHYELDLTINPSDSSIAGFVTMHAHVIHHTERYIMHLDSVFDVSKVVFGFTDDVAGQPLTFVHEDGLVIAELPQTLSAGDLLTATIHYSGRPRKAPDPPWEGGFTWNRTQDGKPWIGVSCQVNGADIWWPVKDHPSDRPDSVSLRITVPNNVTAVSNGLLRAVEERRSGFHTFHWATNAPISNYAVSINIAPYFQITHAYESVSGDVFPLMFWALPENRKKAERLMEQVVDHMRFFEKMLGPYPYRHEKYGIAEAPFFGMEHQTIIAYGAGYRDDTVFDTASGFDDLHHHELAHEWWGNLITAYDWKDFWIHEGFATYMQPLYAEHLHGKASYRYFMKRLYDRIENNLPIAPEEARSAREMFQGRDIYMKGAWVLHTLRKLIGDEYFFASLKKMVYPEGDPAPDEISARFTDTRAYQAVVERIAGVDLDWLFDAYLRHSELPELKKRVGEEGLYLFWAVPSGRSFPMPVEVWDGDEVMRVVPEARVFVPHPKPEGLRVDPYNKVLRAGMFQ